MNRYLTAGLMAFAGFAITAGAASADPRDARPSSDATPAASATAKAPTPERLYCIDDTLTGSRIPKRVCKTASEWKAQGVDPQSL